MKSTVHGSPITTHCRAEGIFRPVLFQRVSVFSSNEDIVNGGTKIVDLAKNKELREWRLLVLGRQKQASLCEFPACLVYIVNQKLQAILVVQSLG